MFKFYFQLWQISPAYIFPFENESHFFKSGLEKRSNSNLLWSGQKHTTNGRNEQRTAPQKFSFF